jgi:hypothetical protein
MDSIYFKAPWSPLLLLITASMTVLQVGISAVGYFTNGPLNLFVVYIPLTILIGTIFFTIRGYQITPHFLYINRFLWQTRISLEALKSVEINPQATKGSLRLFGNGGLYSISGLFRNRTLGKYRAFITDPKKSVVLKFPIRTIVISPDSPELFRQQIETFTVNRS